MKLILCAIFSIGGFINIIAQNCSTSLTGKVIDVDSGDPIISAHVEILGEKQETYTDWDGSFVLDKLCNHPIKIQISHARCDTFFVVFNLMGDTYQEFPLKTHDVKINEVKIVADGNEEKSMTGQEHKIETSVIDSYASASLGDALKEVSGVSSLNTGNTIVKPVIQGLHSSRVAVVNRNIQMEDQEWGIEHAPNVDLNSAGSITVIKGASALQYGGSAIGGVILVESPIYPRQDTLYGKTILSASSNGRGGTVNTSLTKTNEKGFYVNFQGTVKRFGDFEAPDYVLTNTGTFEKDASLNIGFHNQTQGLDFFYSFYNNEIGFLKAAHIGNVSDLIDAINSREPSVVNDFSYDINYPKQDVTHHLARLKYDRHYSNGIWTTEYGYQNNHRLEYDIRVGDDKDTPAVDLHLTTHSLSSNFNFFEHNNYKLNLGMEGSYQKNFPDPATGVRRIIPDYTKYDLGAFITGSYSLSDNLSAEAGVRFTYSKIDAKKYYLITRWTSQGYDEDFSDIIIDEVSSQYLTHPVFDYTYPSFTVGAKYKLGEDMHLSVNYAKANRAPNPAELFSDGLHQSSATIELGDLRLGTEKSNKIALSLEKNKGLFTFSVDPYYNFINDFIYEEPSGVQYTIRGAFPIWQYTQVDASMLGIDVDYKWKLNSNFSYSGTFSYLRGENRDSSEALIDIPPMNILNKVSYNNKNLHNFYAAVSGNYVFKQNRYPDNNFYYNRLEDGEYVNTLVDVSTPPDAYFLLDFNMSAQFNTSHASALEVELKVNNLLNTSYRDYLNRLRYYAENIGRNISIQLKFNY